MDKLQHYLRTNYPEWEKEYYPVSAKEVADTGNVDKMFRHAILKWGGAVRGLDALPFNADSCAFCNAFLAKQGNCHGCPLFEYRDGTRCDHPYFHHDEDTSPFEEYQALGNPEPMQILLKEAYEWWKNQGG